MKQKPKELDWKKTIFNKITEELVKFCRKGDNAFIDQNKYSGKRRNKFVFALTQYIQSLLTRQRTELLEEIMKIIEVNVHVGSGYTDECDKDDLKNLIKNLLNKKDAK